MDTYCRLCLHLCNDVMCHSLADVVLADKIRTCLLVEVDKLDNPSFLQKICTPCLQNIQDFHNYYIKVAKNQILLQMYLEEGNKDLINFLINYNKNVLGTGREQNSFDTKNFEQPFSSKTIKDTQSDIITNIKMEEMTNEFHDFSSDDDLISLSEIKKEKAEENKQNTNIQKQKENKIKKKKQQAKTIEQTVEDKTFQDLHKCLTCSEYSGSKPEIILHYNTVHGSANSECLTDKLTEKYTMEKSDTGEIIYKCCKCTRTDVAKRKMMKHIESHDQNRPFLCRICGRTYKKAYDIYRHGRAHAGPKLSCRFNCGYGTAYSSVLQAHEKRHQRQYKYKCCECGKGFQVLTWFEEHRNLHTGSKPFQCQLCPMAFHMNRYLSAHKSTVHPQESNLGRHVCLHCQRACDNRKALYRHMKEEHGISQRCLCELCGKTLSDPEQLMLHKRVHLGIRPYCCDHCSKSFSKKYNLTVHVRTHSGERTHACAHCRKQYTQGSALRRHRCRPLLH